MGLAGRQAPQGIRYHCRLLKKQSLSTGLRMPLAHPNRRGLAAPHEPLFA
jgi:hypothetical protein